MLCNFSKAVLKDRSHHPMQTLLSNSITARLQKFTMQKASKTFPAQVFSLPHTKTHLQTFQPRSLRRHPSMAAGQRLLGRMSAALPPLVPMCLLSDRAGAALGTRRTRRPRRQGTSAEPPRPVTDPGCAAARGDPPG